MRSPSLEALAAFHESGHAIVAHYLHYKVEHASIERNERSEGRVRLTGDNVSAMAYTLSQLPEIDQYRSRFTAATRERAFDVIIIAVAGMVAERVFAGRKSRLAGTDEIEATLFANVLVGSRRGRRDVIAAAEVECERILVKHDYEVRRVAQVLLAKRRLSGHEVRKIIKQARAVLRSPCGAALSRMLARQRMTERHSATPH
jgi:ATP-dependent Zn protease